MGAAPVVVSQIIWPSSCSVAMAGVDVVVFILYTHKYIMCT